MYMHNGTTDFLKIFSVLAFIAAAVWWLESRFDSLVAVIVIAGLFAAAFLLVGFFAAHVIQKSTLDGINKFNAQDATIDRYRMQSMVEHQRGEAAMRKAAAQLTVIDAKRVDKLASQQARLLTDAERQRWDAAQRSEPADAWTWGDDDDNGQFQSWG